MKRQQSTTQLHLSSDRRWGRMQLPVDFIGGSLCSGWEDGRCESAKSFSQAVNSAVGLASPRLGSEQDYMTINPALTLEAGDRALSLSR